MRPFEIGLVLPMGEVFGGGATSQWANIRDLALRAEEIGFDIVWTCDELLWRPPDRDPQGFWEGVAMTGAVAAATSRIKVGTWILSALHRNPGITAKAVETIDEISGGRFVFGLGSGHAGRQAHAFGLPEDHVYGQFAEAIEIIVPLLRAGHADFEGTFHAARDLEHRPIGPRPGRIPIMIGAKGPKMLRLAALHADTWSWFAEERSDLAEFEPRLAALVDACVGAGRDPETIGKSAGLAHRADLGRGLGGGGLRNPGTRLARGDRRHIASLRLRRLHEHRAHRLAGDRRNSRRDGTGDRVARRRLITSA